jgi:hypothetical protein
MVTWAKTSVPDVFIKSPLPFHQKGFGFSRQNLPQPVFVTAESNCIQVSHFDAWTDDDGQARLYFDHRFRSKYSLFLSMTTLRSRLCSVSVMGR